MIIEKKVRMSNTIKYTVLIYIEYILKYAW